MEKDDYILALIPNYEFSRFIYESKITLETLNKIKILEQKKIKENDSGDVSGFTYNYDDPVMLEFFKQTIFRFNNSDSSSLLKKLNHLFRKATSYRQFHEWVQKEINIINKDWLETEYYTAIKIGFSISTYQRLVSIKNIFPYWEYDGFQCEFNPNHNLLHGIILPVYDQNWKKLYPPNEWNCSCYVKPIMKHEFDELQLEIMLRRVNDFLLHN